MLIITSLIIMQIKCCSRGSILIDEYGVKQDMLKLAHGNPAQEAVVHEFAASVIPQLNLEPSPRVIKSHLPFSLLPPSLLDTCKVNIQHNIIFLHIYIIYTLCSRLCILLAIQRIWQHHIITTIVC
jgi:hypothetical protein